MYTIDDFETPNDYHAWIADLPYLFKRNENGKLQISMPIEEDISCIYACR